VHNYKFALKYHNEFVDSGKKNPSGNDTLDMLLYVRKKMFVAFKGYRNKPTAKQAAGKEHLTEDDMSPKYVFNGYMAFALFGPQGVAEESLSCLSEDGKGVPKKSRAATRKEEAKVKELERNAGTGGYVPEPYRRGVSIHAKATTAFMAQTEYSNSLKNLRELMHMANEEQATNIRELDFIDMQMKGTVNPVDHHQLEFWRDDILSRLTELRTRKRKYEDDIATLLENKPAETEAFYDQVGTFRKPAAKKNKASHIATSVANDKFSQLTQNSSDFSGGNVTIEEEAHGTQQTQKTTQNKDGYVFTQYSFSQNASNY